MAQAEATIARNGIPIGRIADYKRKTEISPLLANKDKGTLNRNKGV